MHNFHALHLFWVWLIREQQTPDRRDKARPIGNMFRLPCTQHSKRRRRAPACRWRCLVECGPWHPRDLRSRSQGRADGTEAGRRSWREALASKRAGYPQANCAACPAKAHFWITFSRGHWLQVIDDTRKRLMSCVSVIERLDAIPGIIEGTRRAAGKLRGSSSSAFLRGIQALDTDLHTALGHP